MFPFQEVIICLLYALATCYVIEHIWDNARQNKPKRKRKNDEIDSRHKSLIFQPGIKIKSMLTDTSYSVRSGAKRDMTHEEFEHLMELSRKHHRILMGDYSEEYTK